VCLTTLCAHKLQQRNLLFLTVCKSAPATYAACHGVAGMLSQLHALAAAQLGSYFGCNCSATKLAAQKASRGESHLQLVLHEFGLTELQTWRVSYDVPAVQCAAVTAVHSLVYRPCQSLARSLRAECLQLWAGQLRPGVDGGRLVVLF
jgi:hypothetical protein